MCNVVVSGRRNSNIFIGIYFLSVVENDEKFIYRLLRFINILLLIKKAFDFFSRFF